MSTCAAYEVPAAAAEVSGVSGGWEGPGGPAGPQSRAHSSQVQHRAHPHLKRVSSMFIYVNGSRTYRENFTSNVKCY